MTQRDLLLRLLTMNQQWDAFVDRMYEIHFDVAMLVDFDFGGLVLDLMGFPADNTAEFAYDDLPDDPRVFCRDWLGQTIHDMAVSRESPEHILKWLTAELAKVQAENPPTGRPPLAYRVHAPTDGPEAESDAEQPDYERKAGRRGSLETGQEPHSGPKKEGR